MAIEQLMKKPITVLPVPPEVVISTVYLEDERPTDLYNIDYLKGKSAKPRPSLAFHEKKEKNKKVNLGGPYKRNPKHGPKHKTTKPPKHRF